MEEFGSKVKSLIKEEYKSASAFAKKIGMNYTQMNRYLNGEKPSLEFIEIVIREFPTIDLNWLLREDVCTGNLEVGEAQVTYQKPSNNEELVKGMETLLQQLKTNMSQK